jgi:hypothetical protein
MMKSTSGICLYIFGFMVGRMKIGVCGIACERCPRMAKGTCPNGDTGCLPRINRMCGIATCAFQKGVSLCFECPEFPCQITRQGPIAYGYCLYLSGKELPEEESNQTE